jgi:hypothetical protein
MGMPGVGMGGRRWLLATVTVTLSDQEVVQLEVILLDRDKDAALDYLLKVVKHKMEQQGKSHCRPPF